MGEALHSAPAMASVARRFARRLVAASANRLELLALELQVERDRLMQAVLLGLGLAVLGLLTTITVTALIVVAFWSFSPWITLLVLSLLYASGAIGCGVRLTRMRREWPLLPKSMDQWRKDQSCIETLLG